MLDARSALTRALEAAASRPRLLLGIAGAPGSGKSTLAAALVRGLRAAGVSAVGVPMDGFHLANAELERLGRADRKGALDTFDGAGYLALLRRLRSERDTVYAPDFDRSIDEPIAGSIPVEAGVRVIVTEGNYLLVDDPPWSQVRSVLDETWFCVLPEAIRLERLVARHMRFGRSRAEAVAWARDVDGVNAALVALGRTHADADVAVD